MIAPLQPPQTARHAPARGLPTARRAVAAALIRASDRGATAATRGSTFWGWMFAAWTMFVAASVFFGGWWKLASY